MEGGATYYIEFELAVPEGEQISRKENTQHSIAGSGETSNIGYVYAESGRQPICWNRFAPKDADGSDKIVVSGGGTMVGQWLLNSMETFRTTTLMAPTG